MRAGVDGTPLPGAWFEVHLPMSRKNPYGLLLGPADERGELRISGAQLLGEARRIIDLFPMDYVSVEAAATGECDVRAVNRPGVERLRTAYETWRDTGYYPPDFSERMAELDLRLSELPEEGRIAVDAEGIPADAVELSVQSVPVGGEAPPHS